MGHLLALELPMGCPPEPRLQLSIDQLSSSHALAGSTSVLEWTSISGVLKLRRESSCHVRQGCRPQARGRAQEYSARPAWQIFCIFLRSCCSSTWCLCRRSASAGTRPISHSPGMRHRKSWWPCVRSTCEPVSNEIGARFNCLGRVAHLLAIISLKATALGSGAFQRLWQTAERYQRMRKVEGSAILFDFNKEIVTRPEQHPGTQEP